MQIIGTCLATGALAARIARIVVIAVAAVLVAGSIATSIARPEPKSVVREEVPGNDPETITTTEGDEKLVALDESTEVVTPAPSAVPSPSIAIDSMVWNAAVGAWTEPDATTAASAGYREDGSVPVLVRISGLAAGDSYRVDIDYASCSDEYTSSFDHIGNPTRAGSIPWLTPPAPARPRPDSMIAAPINHSGGETVSILAWGATFSAEARGASGSADCDDAAVTVEMIARGETVSLGFAGHIRPENATGEPGFAPISVSVERSS